MAATLSNIFWMNVICVFLGSQLPVKVSLSIRLWDSNLTGSLNVEVVVCKTASLSTTDSALKKQDNPIDYLIDYDEKLSFTRNYRSKNNALAKKERL